MTDFDPQMKSCRYCGQVVKMGSYRCPHCGRSLAETEQHEWERLNLPAEPSARSGDEDVPRFSIRISPSALAVCCLIAILTIAAASLYSFFPGRSNKGASYELPSAHNRPNQKTVASGVRKQESGTTSFIRIHDGPDPSEENAAAQGEGIAQSEGEVADERLRQERIGQIHALILEELRNKESNKAYTIHFTSGREIECDIIGESDSDVTIRLGGLTAILQRDSIEKIEHRPAEMAEKELEGLALARATEIVEQGLVRHGQDWITPQEQARRRQRYQARKTSTDTEGQAPKRPESEKAKPERLSFNTKTDLEKLEVLLSLVREKKVVDADFFGGTLHMEDRSRRWPGHNSENASSVAFEAKARRLDVSLVSDFMRLPVAVSGLCSADIEAALDERDPTTLAGDAQVTCEQMTIPPLHFAMLLSPPNKNAALSVSLSAEDRTINIKRFRLAGAAYRVWGKGVVRLSDKLERSRIEASFSIILNEAPTVTDTRLLGKGGQYILDALATTGKEIVIIISGPLSSPEAQLVADSAFGSLSVKLDNF
jgi:hypothetical protein